MQDTMNKEQKKAYDKMIGDTAHDIVMGCYHAAMKITDSVYLDILKKVRQDIDVIIANNEGGEK